MTLPEVGLAPIAPGKVRVTTEDEIKRFVELVQYGSEGWFLSLPVSVIPGCILSSWTSGRNRRDFAVRAIASIRHYEGLLP